MAGFLLLLQACMSAPQTKQLLQSPQMLDLVNPLVHEILDVPFYPQQDFYCGPTTLTEALNYYNKNVQPEQIAPELFIPGRKGSLQIEMLASARRQDMLAYAHEGTLEQLLSLVSENIPVIVLQNLGTSWYPLWHYALVIGYDLDEGKITAHTGLSKHRKVPLRLFENTWRKSNYWLLAIVPPTLSSRHFDPLRYIQSAQDLMETGKSSSAVKALQSAVKQWPEYWLSYLVLGNYFMKDDPQQSLMWFRAGLAAGKDHHTYLNNYAYALQINGCRSEAVEVIKNALTLWPTDQNLLNSLTEIEEMLSGATGTSNCSI